MNETDRQAAIAQYLEEVTRQFYSGHAREHSYRPALERLMMSFDKVHAVNEPKHSEHGAPDFVFLSNNNKDVILGYAEAKDINVSLDKTEKTDQMTRYGGYANLFLTDYLEFRFFSNGEKYETISLGHVKDGKLYKTPENGERLMRELEAFLEQPPETIRNGKRLAQIMGGKARRVRDNVEKYLSEDTDKTGELRKIYEMVKKLLVHDLSEEKFADMYAQTLVYGLFVARYNDTTPDDFSRSEARDLVPRSNPFLRHFFDHIAGPNFVVRLGYIIDELCEVFEVSDVQKIVHKHLRILDTEDNTKDPIIHFYEDFLQEYDKDIRKSMGAYYTPTPVVQFIVRQVDKILKEEFGLSQGLASTETVQYEVETGQDLRHDRRKAATTHQTLTVPRVQILDPAVGTATFLNETIKFIYEGFKGQEGRWPSYVNDNLLKRLHGFELMMAPYTIAHLKLGMTLKESGVDKVSDRLGVYLTNTLEEGIPQQPDLFSFGLAEAVSEESRLAAEVKNERPVMVVVGNPPYSGESSNNTKYANNLVSKYRKEPGGVQPLKERTSKWLNDDYVKFISFSESMIKKNGSGIVAMITNNGYLDNPTFRGMRWHLTKTFNKIYILDLHGNSKKKETAPDGSKDVNVFDIMQGVSIILAVKTSDSIEEAEVFHSEIYGERKTKFETLDSNNLEFKKINLDKKNYYFIPQETTGKAEYDAGAGLDQLFNVVGAGISTAHDSFVINKDKDALLDRFTNFKNETKDGHLYEKFNVKEKAGWDITKGWDNLQKSENLESLIKPISYRPFDNQYIFYEDKLVWRTVRKVMDHYASDNIGLLFTRMTKGRPFAHAFLTETLSEVIFLSPLTGTNAFNAPLYLYHDDGTKTPNFNNAELSALTQNLDAKPSPEQILNYIYAILYSPDYRDKFKVFLKTDFPRIPIPKNDTEFNRLAKLGHQLQNLHLMKSRLLDTYDTTYPEQGSGKVEAIKYENNKVWINDMQYFGNVPQIAWDFHIGGYQPAQKWLKDRKGQSLSNEDIEHYQKIIKVLIETDKIMKEIG